MIAAATAVQSAAAASSAAATSTAAAPATSGLNYNSFLTLLMAEMKNQDPTQPMDPTQMVSQLATISQVGQAVQTNSTLSALLAQTEFTQAEQLIGKTVVSSDGSISGKVASISFTGSDIIATLTDGKTISVGNIGKVSA
jgi:flagellar basal-body rod modification protein FlgD